jgi:hypothetical protein
MAVRWLIFRNGETLGPWGSARVRAELRAGRIEPTDLIAAEGEMIRRPLIDVDAIFDGGAIQPAAIELEFPQASQLQKSSKTELSADVVSVSDQPRQRTYEALASPDRLHATVRPQRRSKTGSSERIGGTFIIWVPNGRPQGPFTVKDIMTLWAAGKLGPGTKIQKSDGQRRVPVEVFLSYYARQAAGTSLVFRQGAWWPNETFRAFTWFVGLIVLLVGLALINELMDSDTGSPVSATATPPDKRAPKPIDEPKGPIDPTITPLITTPVMPPTSARESGASKALETGATESLRPQQSSSSFVLKPIVTRAPKPARTPNLVAKSNEPSMPRFKEGQTLRLSHYRFDLRMLESCQVKCKLPMFGPQGPVTVVFFKEAFGALLQSQAQSVSMTGIVRRDSVAGGWLFILQAVENSNVRP